MALSDYLKGAGVLAYWFYWDRHEMYRSKEWMILCYPLNAVYVRPLSLVECQLYLVDHQVRHYGAFNQFTGAMIAIHQDELVLCAIAYTRGYLPCVIQ